MKNRIGIFFCKVVFILFFIFPIQLSHISEAGNNMRNGDSCASPYNTGYWDGVFSIPELQIIPSPSQKARIAFPASEKIIDFDVSPAGSMVAALVVEPSQKYSIKFWEIGQSSISENFPLPEGLSAKAITWHPNSKVLFIMGIKEPEYLIFRIEKRDNSWTCQSIFSSGKQLRRLVACPRPFIIHPDGTNHKPVYSYRLFFGMDNGDKTFRIVSVTEYGERFYQVIGPFETISEANSLDADVPPSQNISGWALPVAFHPGGHQMIWQDSENRFHVVGYDSKYWGNTHPLNISIANSGTITPTPNGLGLIHWQKGKPGIGIYLISTKKEEMQITDCLFVSTPSSVPDGKGIVGLAFSDGCYSLNYVPVNVPLADVVNAWMYAGSGEEIELFSQNYGLMRPNCGDQLYKLYESENYYCNSYDRNSPTRPYLVTTDIFWELFGAAYQGLFIVKERDVAIPNFWKYVDAAGNYLLKQSKNSSWKPVFKVLGDLHSGNPGNPEVQRILGGKDCFSEIIQKSYKYSDLKPRGHYTSSPEMKTYFMAFRYFISIFSENQDVLKELNFFPPEVNGYAKKWIESYTGFISGPRSPLVWGNIKQDIPGYCRYPQKVATVFPLSWGFDNEVLYSTVYHPSVPPEIQVKGSSGERVLPSGLDLASAIGNGLAAKWLELEYKKYPPLKKIIENLAANFKECSANPNSGESLYNKWINAVAVQWSDSCRSINGENDSEIWQAKRLQTGLATWATLRHATILVNERTAAECGEGGFEEILMRAPRGFVEPDPNTFAVIAGLFDSAIDYVSSSLVSKPDIRDSADSGQHSLYEGILVRLKEAAQEARSFQYMAEKEIRGEMLSNEENEKILYVARTGEHLFLVFSSLSNDEFALSNPDPVAKIADVAGGNLFSPYLLSAVGNTMEWDYIIPFYGRHEIVKGAIYSYYEFVSPKLLDDDEWRRNVEEKEFLPWIKPYITCRNGSGMAKTGY